MVKVLFDHNMPPRMARAVNEVIAPDGHSAFALRDRFPIDINDVDYFAALSGGYEWIVVSKDTTMAKRPAEKQAILRSGVLAFFLRPSVQKQPIHQQTATILWHWDKIVQQRKLNERGLFELPINKGAKFRPL